MVPYMHLRLPACQPVAATGDVLPDGQFALLLHFIELVAGQAVKYSTKHVMPKFNCLTLVEDTRDAPR